MRRTWFVLILISLGLFVGVVFAELVNVRVKKDKVRVVKSHIGPGKWVYRGDKLEKLKEEKSWVNVKIVETKGEKVEKGMKGWIHKSSISEEKLKPLSTYGGKVGVSESQAGAATKGFDAETEKEYAKRKNLNYTKVNEIENYSVDEEKFKQFLNEGKLSITGGLK